MKSLKNYILFFVCDRIFKASLNRNNFVIDLSREKLEAVIKHQTSRSFLFLDGYDEYSKLGGNSPELDRIITREAFKTLNILISTRPWKASSLGTDFQRVDIQELEESDAKQLIRRFFKSSELGKDLN